MNSAACFPSIDSFTHTNIHIYFHSLEQGQWPQDRVHPVTAMLPPTPVHTQTHTHTAPPYTLDWLRLIVPVSCLVPCQTESPPDCADDVYSVWLFDRAIVSFALPPELFFSLSPTSSLFSPFILSLCLSCCLTFLTLLLSPLSCSYS